MEERCFRLGLQADFQGIMCIYRDMYVYINVYIYMYICMYVSMYVYVFIMRLQ